MRTWKRVPVEEAEVDSFAKMALVESNLTTREFYSLVNVSWWLLREWRLPRLNLLFSLSTEVGVPRNISFSSRKLKTWWQIQYFLENYTIFGTGPLNIFYGSDNDPAVEKRGAYETWRWKMRKLWLLSALCPALCRSNEDWMCTIGQNVPSVVQIHSFTLTPTPPQAQNNARVSCECVCSGCS